MGKFARVTGNVSQAQKLLKTALNASAYAGVPLEKVSTALAKAYTGNTSSLIRLFPELKKSKDAINDLSGASEGFAQKNADPFMRFNNAMDTLKESLGYVILPMISDFVDEISKPGGLIDITKKYLEDLSDPKTEAGATFKSIKDAVEQTFGAVKDFFALFGGGDSMKGFANAAETLVRMLPALIALKGILFLAKSTTVIANLAKAIGLMQGTTAVSTTATATGAGSAAVAGKAATSIGTGVKATEFANGVKALKGLKAAPLLGVGNPSLTWDQFTTQGLVDKNIDAFRKAGYEVGFGGNDSTVRFIESLFGMKLKPNPYELTPQQAQVVINNYSADPKVVTDAVNKYLKNNGGKSITNPGGR